METAVLTSRELVNIELKQIASSSSFYENVIELKQLNSKSYFQESSYISDSDLIQTPSISYFSNISPVNNKSLFENFGFNFNLDTSLLQIEFEIKKLAMQNSLLPADDIRPPNLKAIKLAINVARNLAKYDILNYKVKPSVEEGIAFIFKSKNRKMYFEFYNDGENGFIIEDYVHKKIIANKKVDSINEIVINILNFIR